MKYATRRSPLPLLLLLLLPLLLPAPAPAAPAADPFAAFVASLGKGDMKTAGELLSADLDPEARAGFLDAAQAKRNAAALGKLRFKRQLSAPGEIWRVYEVPGKREFLFVALGTDGRILGLLPAGNDRARSFAVLPPKGGTGLADPAAIADTIRRRFSAFESARAAVGVEGEGLRVVVAGLEEGDLPKHLIAARGAYSLRRIVGKGRRLPFLPVYGAAQRAPEAVDEREILGPGMIRETSLSYSATNLPQVKFSATPEGTRRLTRFHRECADPDKAMCALVLDGRIVNRIGVSRAFLGGVFWVDGFFKAEDAQFVRALVACPPLPSDVRVEEGEPL